MTLVMTDVDRNPLKRWACMYGLDQGWNIDENTVTNILSKSDDHPTLAADWPEFLNVCRYYDENFNEFKLEIKDNNLFLEAV